MLFVYFFLLIVAPSVQPITHVIDVTVHRTRRATMCNSSSVDVYDTTSQQCCAGKVFPLETGTNHECCGQKRFDMMQQKCCGNVLHPLNAQLECCGNEYHLPRDGICCFSHYTGKFNVVKFAEEIVGNEEVKKNMQCCGVKLFNKLTHTCCMKKRTKQALHESFPNLVTENVIYRSNDTFAEFKYVGELDTAQEMFTSELLNTPIYQIQDVNMKSCPETSLNFSDINRAEIFDEMELTDVAKLEAKCNEEKYNMTTHVCCPTQSENEFNFKGESKLHVKKSWLTGCCGLEAFNFDTEICCNNQNVHKQNDEGSLQCCGDVVYDTATQKCCSFSNLLESATTFKESESCCGESKTKYNFKTQICCGGVVEYKDNNRMKCCHGQGKTGVLYSDDTEICCNGLKYEKIPGKVCCGSMVVDESNQICCRGKVHTKTTPDENCCGSNIYNNDSHVCCEYDKTVVAKKESDDNRCCGSLSYNKNKEVCCSAAKLGSIDNMFSGKVTHQLKTKLVPKTSETTACCGLKIYDKSRGHCCNGKICKPTKKKMAICGSAVYDRNELLCCKTHLYTFDTAKTRQCCGAKAFYPERQRCCKGVIKNTDAPNTAKCCYDDTNDLPTVL